MHLPRLRSGLITLAAAAIAVPTMAISASASPTSAPTAASTTAHPAAAAPLVHAQILAFNDFHGHLEPDGLSISAATGTSHGHGYVPAGGAAYLAATINAAKKANPASLVTSSGDLVGASPMVSGYYHDDPTIEAMNHILDVGVVGNHEFDEGTKELRRLIGGGCPAEGCPNGGSYTGANFDVLAANVIDRATGKSIFPGYTIKDVGGAKIGFIGTVTTQTPGLVPASGIKDVKFLNEEKTIKALIPTVRAAGADAIVVLTHTGSDRAAGSINNCAHVSGPATKLASDLSGQVDAVLSAHTHLAYVCRVKKTLLTQAASYGRALTTVKLTIDPNAHKVTSISARNGVVGHKITPDPTVARLVAADRALVAPIATQKVGTLTKKANRIPDSAGETPLGDLVADAELAATKPAKAQLAIVNGGFIRSDLPKGAVNYDDVYTAQPFGHALVTMTLTGKQLDNALESQFCNAATVGNDPRVPFQISTGLSYGFNLKKPCGHRIRMADTLLHGKPIRSTGHYRVTTNSFFASGGNQLRGFVNGTHRVTGVLDRDAVAKYFRAHKTLTPPHRTRQHSL
jgi:5'-nucleotidase